MKHLVLLLLCLCALATAQPDAKPVRQHDPQNNLFKSIEPELPSPNSYRTGSGAPGHEYWQNRADYQIEVSLDDSLKRIKGKETITYINNSPDVLTYLFVQLEQNYLDPNGITWQTESQKLERMDTEAWNNLNYRNTFPGGYRILSVTDAAGKPLKYQIHHTNLRIDLPTPLVAKTGKFSLRIEWEYNIQDHQRVGMRTGYEQLADGNRIYELAHWFPRMAMYHDAEGWQNQHFLGRGEFTLPFGNYQVTIDAPEDFVVAATGELMNRKAVLTATQQERWAKATTEKVQPVLIITQAEADENAKRRATGRKKWQYTANDVRDFAWAASRRFIWDAMGADLNGRTIMCMSYYPKEGNPIWEMVSTKAVAHTVKTYSKYTADFPWPTMISVNGPVGGMEYPMITFNGTRPEKDGTYSEGQKNGLVSLIVHEVGHNFFPMLINSDERDHTWQDEGFNSFIQYLTLQEWGRTGFEGGRGAAWTLEDFLRKQSRETICMHSDHIHAFGPTQYHKVAVGLNILRETVLGRQLFDFAFKTYCQRWAFKHPRPADFFRSMEDASGVDLDWYWRGWWMGSDPVDINLTKVTRFRLDRQNPEENMAWEKQKAAQRDSLSIDTQRNKKDITSTYDERDGSLKDFYTTWDDYAVNDYHRRVYERFVNSLTEEDKKNLNQNKYYYQLDFVNEGGMMMPIVLELVYADGSRQEMRIPVEVWRYDNYRCYKALILDKPLAKVIVDPWLETPDIDRQDNTYPREIEIQTLEIYKKEPNQGLNPMQLQKMMGK